MVLTTQKAKQSLKRLNPKPQAHTDKMHENTEGYTINNVSRLRDPNQARN